MLSKTRGNTNKIITVGVLEMDKRAIKKFNADAVIDNYSYKESITLFKIDAEQAITIKNDCYTICGLPIRGADKNIGKIELRCKYAFGKVRRGKKDLFNKHVFNIDMVVHADDKIWSTPLCYFYEDSYERGDKRCRDWLNTVFDREYVFKPTKEQIKAVMQWIVAISKESKYKNCPAYELHKRASRYIVDECIKVLEQTKCIAVADIKGVVVLTATDKGAKAVR